MSNGDLYPEGDEPRPTAKSGLSAELEAERLLIVRAKRRLLEHELTERRVLLCLTVAFALGGAAASAAADVLTTSVLAGFAAATGTMARVRSRSRPREE